MKLDWRVVLGAMGILVLTVIGSFIGSYFGIHWRYQSDDERLKPPPSIGKVSTTPIDSHPTDRETYPDSAPATVTSDEEKVFFEATDASEAEQAIRESLVQLRIKKVKAEAEINRLNDLRNKLTKQRGQEHERLTTEMVAHQKMVEKEVERLSKIIGEKLGPNPTLQDYLSIEEGHQLRKMLREDDSLEATLAIEDTYRQKIDEVEQKTTELFEERSVIMARIKDLASQLAVE